MDNFVVCVVCLSIVILSCVFLAALWSPAGKGLTSWLSCMFCFLVFFSCFPICVLIHIRTTGEFVTVKHF